MKDGGKIVISGGTGFIGSHLVRSLVRRGYEVIVLTRSERKDTKKVKFIKADISKSISPEIFDGAYGVINLAGESLFSRWNDEKKKRIYDSRINSTKNIVKALSKVKKKPKVLVSASAVGIYGDRGEEVLDESVRLGKDFLSKLCINWEKEAVRAEKLGIRVVQIRTAPVLGEGGMLEIVLPLYRLWLGGTLGSGNQYFPWIHVKDLIKIYIFALEVNKLKGPVNSASPQEIRYKEFNRSISDRLNIYAFWRIPKWWVKILFGELADFLFASQRVVPKKLKDLKFIFSYPDIDKALKDVLRN